jgi:hypothetical protein
MQTVTTVGLDIAKSVFQVHCVDGVGQVVASPGYGNMLRDQAAVNTPASVGDRDL